MAHRFLKRIQAICIVLLACLAVPGPSPVKAQTSAGFAEKLQPFGQIYRQGQSLAQATFVADNILVDANLSNAERRAEMQRRHEFLTPKITDLRAAADRASADGPGLSLVEEDLLEAIRERTIAVLDATEAHIAQQAEFMNAPVLERLTLLQNMQKNSIARRQVVTAGELAFLQAFRATVKQTDLDYHQLSVRIAFSGADGLMIGQVDAIRRNTGTREADREARDAFQANLHEARVAVDAAEGKVQQMRLVPRPELDQDLLGQIFGGQADWVALHREAIGVYRGYGELLWKPDGTRRQIDPGAFAEQDQKLVELGQRMDANSTLISDLSARLLRGTQKN